MPTKNLNQLDDGPLPEALENAVDEYIPWNARHIEAEQARSTITAPLYQYTDWTGLCGIIESQSVWITNYRHLNDPSEFSDGVEVAHEVMDALKSGADDRVRLLLGMVRDLWCRGSTLAASISSPPASPPSEMICVSGELTPKTAKALRPASRRKCSKWSMLPGYQRTNCRLLGRPLRPAGNIRPA